MSEIELKCISILDAAERDCLVLTYSKLPNSNCRKRLIPIRPSLWKSTGSDLTFNTDSHILLQCVRVALELKRNHAVYLQALANPQLIQMVITLKLRALNRTEDKDQRPPPVVDWMQMDTEAHRIWNEYAAQADGRPQAIGINGAGTEADAGAEPDANADWHDLPEMIAKLQSVVVKSEKNKKQVSFKDIPEQFRFEKYAGEDEFDAFQASLVRRDETDDEDEDEDFVF